MQFKLPDRTKLTKQAMIIIARPNLTKFSPSLVLEMNQSEIAFGTIELE